MLNGLVNAGQLGTPVRSTARRSALVISSRSTPTGPGYATTPPYALNVESGNAYFAGSLSVVGTAYATTYSFMNQNLQMSIGGSYAINFHTGGTVNAQISGLGPTFTAPSSGSFGFASGALNSGSFNNSDVELTRDAANKLALRKSTNAQSMGIYGTYTSTTSYERVNVKGKAAANFEIGPENGSAGGTLRGLTIGGYALGSATITGWLQFRPNATTAALEAFYLGPIADSTAVGGNARGTGAVDLQTSRTAAAQVASGDQSFSSGINNTVSGAKSGAVGSTNSVSGANSFAVGNSNVVSGSESIAFGNTHSVSHAYSIATGIYAKTQFAGQRVMSLDSYNGQGGAQLIEATNKQRSTSATPVNWDLPIASGRTYHFQILVAGVKSDGSGIACYTRRVSAKNVAGTVTIVNNQTIGTDYEDNASTDVAVTASTTNVRISVTGIAAETWRWQFALHGVEIEYGT